MLLKRSLEFKANPREPPGSRRQEFTGQNAGSPESAVPSCMETSQAWGDAGGAVRLSTNHRFFPARVGSTSGTSSNFAARNSSAT